jgi:hypothetical protein
LCRNSKDEEGNGDDSASTMDCGRFAMESAFEDLKLHVKIYDARAPEKGCLTQLMVTSDTTGEREEEEEKGICSRGEVWRTRCYS